MATFRRVDAPKIVVLLPWQDLVQLLGGATIHDVLVPLQPGVAELLILEIARSSHDEAVDQNWLSAQRRQPGKWAGCTSHLESRRIAFADHPAIRNPSM